MAKHLCAVPGCTEANYGFSTLCGPHKRLKRRHGHPQQVPVQVKHLAPYARLVDQRVSLNAGSEAWAILDQRWKDLTAHHAERVQAAYAGQTYVRHELMASEQIHKLALEVSSVEVIRTVLAMYVLQEFEPRRFICDQGFDFQMVRRVRGLTTSNVGTYWDHETRKVKKVYVDTPPRTVVIVADELKRVFGATGIAVARLERLVADQVDPEPKRLARALESLA